MTDYNKPQRFIDQIHGRRSIENSFLNLKSLLDSSRRIPSEIEEMMFTLGGKWFKPNVELVLNDENKFSLLHFMDIEIKGGQ